MIKQHIADFIACHNTQTMHINTVAFAVNVYCLCWNRLSTAAVCRPWADSYTKELSYG